MHLTAIVVYVLAVATSCASPCIAAPMDKVVKTLVELHQALSTDIITSSTAKFNDTDETDLDKLEGSGISVSKCGNNLTRAAIA